MDTLMAVPAAKRRKVIEFQCKCALTHQMSQSTSVRLRMFAVLSRSRKPRDAVFSVVDFSTCGETQSAVQWALSFSTWDKAEVRGSYAGWEEDDMWSFHSIRQSRWPQQEFCFLQTATRHQPARRLRDQPGGHTRKCVRCNLAVENALLDIGEGLHVWLLVHPSLCYRARFSFIQHYHYFIFR